MNQNIFLAVLQVFTISCSLLRLFHTESRPYLLSPQTTIASTPGMLNMRFLTVRQLSTIAADCNGLSPRTFSRQNAAICLAPNGFFISFSFSSLKIPRVCTIWRALNTTVLATVSASLRREFASANCSSLVFLFFSTHGAERRALSHWVNTGSGAWSAIALATA